MDAGKYSGGQSLEELRRQQEAIRNKFTNTFSPTSISPEYAARVFGSKNPDAPKVDYSQTIPYQNARVYFASLLLERQGQLRQIKNDNSFTWAFTESDKENIRNLIKWAINDPTGAYDVAKGLFVYGNPGTGKTEILLLISEFCRDYNTKPFEFTSMSAVYTKAKSDKDYDPVTPNVSKNRLFDEFGRYTGQVISYGEKIDINEAVIEQRYERYKRYGQQTHFIVNYQREMLDQLVSDMLVDRIKEMTQDVYFEGESKR